MWGGGFSLEMQEIPNLESPSFRFYVDFRKGDQDKRSCCWKLEDFSKAETCHCLSNMLLFCLVFLNVDYTVYMHV